MSLGGLAVAIGIIIDDAVVVVENIERRLVLHPDQPPREVVREATDEIVGPVAASTLTTIVVFPAARAPVGGGGRVLPLVRDRAGGGGAVVAGVGDDGDPDR